MELKELIANKERINVLISLEDLLELFRQVSGRIGYDRKEEYPSRGILNPERSPPHPRHQLDNPMKMGEIRLHHLLSLRRAETI